MTKRKSLGDAVEDEVVEDEVVEDEVVEDEVVEDEVVEDEATSGKNIRGLHAASEVYRAFRGL